MIRFTLKNWTNLLYIIGITIVFSSCQRSEYDRTVKSEMAKNLELNELKFGLEFKDTKDEFFAKCKALNQQKLVTHGGNNQNVQHILNDTAKAPIRYLFYGTFDDKRVMTGLNMTFSYLGWAPWNEHLYNKELLQVVMDTLQIWYPGNEFKVLENEKLDYPIYYKVDGNRQILLHLEGTRDVIGLIQDLNQKQY